MKTSWPWMVALSLTLAGLAALYANALLKQINRDEPKMELISVVVAAQDIAAKAEVEQADVKTIQAASKPDGLYSDVKEVIGEVAQQAFYAGEMISRKRFTEPPVDNPISELLTKGKQAVTLAPTLANFVLPESRVDVITTERGGPQTILQNVRVLAVNQETNPEKVDRTDINTVTLEVEPELAKRVAGVRNVQLTLRKPGDENIMEVSDEPPDDSKDEQDEGWRSVFSTPPVLKHEVQVVRSREKDVEVQAVELSCKSDEDGPCVYSIKNMKKLP